MALLFGPELFANDLDRVSNKVHESTGRTPWTHDFKSFFSTLDWRLDVDVDTGEFRLSCIDCWWESQLIACVWLPDSACSIQKIKFCNFSNYLTRTLTVRRAEVVEEVKMSHHPAKSADFDSLVLELLKAPRVEARPIAGSCWNDQSQLRHRQQVHYFKLVFDQPWDQGLYAEKRFILN